jgi:uncharacterized membrane protein YcaP (DUF421 family)
VDVLVYIVRVFLVFLFTYFAARTLSQKAIAEMTAYEIAGLFILSNVAAEPLVTKVLSKSILGTGLLAFLILVFSRLALLNKLTPIMEHNAMVLIRNGQLDVGALKTSTLSINQLMGLLREKGYDKVTDVEFAILEPQGKLSVIPMSQKRPVQPKDLNISTNYEGLTLPLIVDGTIIKRNLEHVNLSEEWLCEELRNQGVTNYKEQISLAELDTQGNLNLSWK